MFYISSFGKDIHYAWKDISADEAKRPETYYTRFQTYVRPKLNPILAKYEFFKQTQENDTIEAFITRLIKCARDCNFNDAVEMIRDRIVFREKLNESISLTFDKAIQLVQNMYFSKKQLSTMAGIGDKTDHHVRRRSNNKNAQKMCETLRSLLSTFLFTKNIQNML